MNFEKRRLAVERMAESKIVPNGHVFVSIFVWEIEEKMEKYSQSGYFSSAVTFLSPQRKWILKNRRQEVECVAESKIVLN